MQLAAYPHQCEIVHINIFVCNENLSEGTVSQWKVFIPLWWLQERNSRLATSKQQICNHGFVRALSSMFDKTVFDTRIKKS